MCTTKRPSHVVSATSHSVCHGGIRTMTGCWRVAFGSIVLHLLWVQQYCQGLGSVFCFSSLFTESLCICCCMSSKLLNNCWNWLVMIVLLEVSVEFANASNVIASCCSFIPWTIQLKYVAFPVSVLLIVSMLEPNILFTTLKYLSCPVVVTVFCKSLCACYGKYSELNPSSVPC